LARQKAKGKLVITPKASSRKYRKRGHQKDKRGIIKDSISIEQPLEVKDKRDRFVNLEVGLITGKNHNQAMLSINDRASRKLKIRKVPSKESKVASQAIVEERQDWQPIHQSLQNFSKINYKKVILTEFGYWNKKYSGFK